MALALVALLVMVTLAALLMTSAANLRKRSASVAYQNTQCEILAEFIADELTRELQTKSGTLWNNIYTMIENQVWPRYDNTVSEEENRKTNAIQTYPIELDFSDGTLSEEAGLPAGAFSMTMDIYWEMSDQMYINTANKELVIRLICESTDGGYYAVLLRYESANEIAAGLNYEEYWFGKWLFLWQERA
jgi:hypothetical protein